MPTKWSAPSRHSAASRTAAHAYFAKLTSAPYKRFVEVGEGTHTIIMEKNRMQFFREVMNFLSETDPQASN